ncbi:MAG: isochorismate synthase [Brevibacterium sp.]|uniref:isochorismate synthase n=1 Tax=Brevibacterium sp. TaxID=1701 RepID=UPI002648B248|nr:isochorismate synthase [Brevibacterium sp.]MDN5805963.1 isochorismate synthase [Brevibacterium sp.]MDN5833295.1 isochorismate synthase [Brevibacterium sp.]MDN5876229.1 isochorismate synthase [Brevibacterium sp.]MDN5908157.1 isochorismate synthase [Brevibacterium sp.]MDN6134701.1 isochorismate synthase [Brevibacterium sp.]
MTTTFSTSDISAAPPRLHVRSRFVDDVEPGPGFPFESGLPTTVEQTLELLPTSAFSCWVRDTSGLIGFGRTLRIRARGRHRFTELSDAWKTITTAATIEDEVDLLGSGLMCFATVAYSGESEVDSLIHVPEFVLGRRGGRVWMTSIIAEGAATPTPPVLKSEPLRRVTSAKSSPGDLDSAAWADLVAKVSHMLTPVEDSAEVDAFTDDSTLRKIVLARDELVTTDDDIDVRSVLGALNRSYPSCWTFDVAGLIGSTPELLIGVENNRVSSRVLAGTYRVETDPSAELPAARKLLSAHKDSTEHAFAIASLQRSLSSVADDVSVDERPHLLPLANVIHSASDAAAHLPADSCLNALDIAAAVHPTAAVGGYPQASAVAHVDELEPLDRGRYSGPVGWMDGRGNGQFGIALRCGQLEDRNRIRLFAGAGIMPDSDPLAEVAETEAKFAPMRRALGLE